MQHTRFAVLTMIAVALMISWGPVGKIGAQSSQLPTCTGWSNCNRGPVICLKQPLESFPPYVGSISISDLPDGVSSDRRGPYVAGRDGVRYTMAVLGNIGLLLGDAEAKPNRIFRVNLDHPVPGGGGVPLGLVTAGGDNQLYTARKLEGKTGRSMVGIPVGQTENAGMMIVSFLLDERFHILQMGPDAYGGCHGGADTTRVHGAGTSAGTVRRASRSTWVMDLPAGSIGRLFDVSHTTKHAVDKGLYFVRLHYEFTNALPSVFEVLRQVVETQGGPAVVARYRELKRDSAQTYYFGANQINPSGFWLLDTKKPQDAVIVFRLAVDEYPDDAESHEGLGEAYLGVADTTKAIASYRRSMELNPKNQNVAAILKRLGAKS